MRSTSQRAPVRPRGFSIVEVLVAMGLTLALLTSASLALSNASSTLADNRTRDAAVVLASSIASQARVLGCQAQTNPTTAPSAASQTAAITQRCSDMAQDLSCPETTSDTTANASVTALLQERMREICAQAPPTLPGDGEFLAMDPTDSTRVFKVIAASRWLRSTQTDTCPATDPSLAVEKASPAILERTVMVVPDPIERVPYYSSATNTLEWRAPAGLDGFGLGPYSTVALETVTPGGGLDFGQTGSIAAYTADTGNLSTLPSITLAAGSAPSPIARYVSRCVTPSGQSALVAWFPFLTPNTTYTLTSSSTGKTSNVTVVQGQVVEVTL